MNAALLAMGQPQRKIKLGLFWILQLSSLRDFAKSTIE
jgi:hypothetical protein